MNTIDPTTGEISESKQRKITDVMPPFSSTNVAAKNLGNTSFYIVDIQPVNTRFGDRYVYTLRVGEETISLFLSKTTWRDRLFTAWKADPSAPIGPLTLRKEGRTYIFADVSNESDTDDDDAQA